VLGYCHWVGSALVVAVFQTAGVELWCFFTD
jgi:hypothetical protein